MQVVVESGCQILTDDALPFPFACSKVSLVGLQILHYFQTDVLLQQLLWLLDLFLHKLSRLYIITNHTSHYELNVLQLHVIVTDPEGWQVGIRVLDLILLLVLVHVSYIFQIRDHGENKFKRDGRRIPKIGCLVRKEVLAARTEFAWFFGLGAELFADVECGVTAWYWRVGVV